MTYKTELELEMERRPGLYSINPPAKKKKLITNKALLAELQKSKEMGQITDEFVRLLSMMVERTGHQRNWVNYQNWDDMRVNAMRHLVERKMCMSFNPELSDNPFGYYALIIRNSFAQTLHQLKKERLIAQGKPDRLMVALHDHAMKVIF